MDKRLSAGKECVNLHPCAGLPFKRIFGEHPDLAICLLNALLPLKKKEERFYPGVARLSKDSLYICR